MEISKRAFEFQRRRKRERERNNEKPKEAKIEQGRRKTTFEKDWSVGFGTQLKLDGWSGSVLLIRLNSNKPNSFDFIKPN